MRKIVLNFMSSLGQLIKYGCVIHCTFEYLGDFVVCSGPSMEPTINSNDVLFTDHLTVLRGRFNRGDIVIAKCPTNPKQQICKRIIGMPGDKVRTGFASSETVPIGHVWLEGDNSSNSSDSRVYGPVPQGLIRSRAICKVWPLKDVAFLTS